MKPSSYQEVKIYNMYIYINVSMAVCMVVSAYKVSTVCVNGYAYDDFDVFMKLINYREAK
jgi:hypothetical protein